MHRTPTSLIVSGIAAAMLAVASPQAGAQDQPQTQPPQAQAPQTQAPPGDFSQQQLEAFADAATELQRVQTDFNEQAKNVEDQDEITRLHQQAQTEASQAVENSGLSVEEYSAIAQAANADPKLYAMIVDLMKQRSPR